MSMKMKLQYLVLTKAVRYYSNSRTCKKLLANRIRCVTHLIIGPSPIFQYLDLWCHVIIPRTKITVISRQRDDDDDVPAIQRKAAAAVQLTTGQRSRSSLPSVNSAAASAAMRLESEKYTISFLNGSRWFKQSKGRTYSFIAPQITKLPGRR